MFFEERVALFGVEASSSEEVIKIAADELYKRGIVKEDFYEHVMLREKEFPTGLATAKYGVAIPHTDSKYVNRSQIEFISLKSPVKFKNMGDVSEDIEVTHIFMIAMSQSHEQSETLTKLMGMFLPYEKQLAKQYEVSVSTVRKALSELEQRGFVKTLNGKGTIVIEPDDTKIHQLALDSGYVKKALRYLHALQLMVLIIRPAALAAVPQFTKEELEELADKFNSSDSIYLSDILKAIMRNTTLEPLYVILSETNHLLEWGHHFTYYPSKKHTLSHLNKQVILAFQQLRKGNAVSFADGIADCYRYNLICMKNHMVEKYKFYHVANIRVPEKY